jgi:hypothetical protein
VGITLHLENSWNRQAALEVPAGMAENLRHAGARPTYGLSPGLKRPHSLSLNNPEFVVARARAYPWFTLRNFHVTNDTVILEGDPATLFVGVQVRCTT